MFQIVLLHLFLYFALKNDNENVFYKVIITHTCAMIIILNEISFGNNNTTVWKMFFAYEFTDFLVIWLFPQMNNLFVAYPERRKSVLKHHILSIIVSFSFPFVFIGEDIINNTVFGNQITFASFYLALGATFNLLPTLFTTDSFLLAKIRFGNYLFRIISCLLFAIYFASTLKWEVGVPTTIITMLFVIFIDLPILKLNYFKIFT